MKKMFFILLLIVFLFPTISTAGNIYRGKLNGVKFYTNKKINNYDKVWKEVKFDNTKKITKAKPVIEEDNSFLYEQKNVNKNIVHYNKYIDKPKYYEKRLDKLVPVYVYPNISTRQAHAKAGHPLFWKEKE